MLLTLRSIWLGAGTLIAGALAIGGLIRPGPTTRLTSTSSTLAPTAARAHRTPQPAVADSVVALGLRLRGTEYCYAGTTPEQGFDCSGFVTYCFSRFGIAVPHSSDLQSRFGRDVPRAQARPGDIVIFAGTAAGSRSPGHAGIVISQPGAPLRFVHSSSARKEHGVKVSQVDSTRYEGRFLGIRRVIDDNALARAPLTPTPEPTIVPLREPVVAPVPQVVPILVVPTHRASPRVGAAHRRRAIVAPRRHTTTRAAAPRPKTRAAVPKKKVAATRKATTAKAATKKPAVKKPAAKKKPTAKPRTRTRPAR